MSSAVASTSSTTYSSQQSGNERARRSVKAFAQAHIEKTALSEATRARRALLNGELNGLRRKMMKELEPLRDTPVMWSSEGGSSGIVKLKTNNSQRKLSEVHVQDVLEDVEVEDVSGCFTNGADFESCVSDLAEKLSKSINAARTVSTTVADVKLGEVKRKPKDVGVASSDVIALAQEIDRVRLDLAALNDGFKMKSRALDEEIEQHSGIVESMLRSKNTTTQKMNICNERDEHETYFIRIKPDGKRPPARTLSANKILEIMKKVLLNVLSTGAEASRGGQGTDGVKMARVFSTNREAIISAIVRECDVATSPDPDDAEERDEETDGNQLKLCFDKSTGSRKRSLESDEPVQEPGDGTGEHVDERVDGVRETVDEDI
jgi:hypothetical protein